MSTSKREASETGIPSCRSLRSWAPSARRAYDEASARVSTSERKRAAMKWAEAESRVESNADANGVLWMKAAWGDSACGARARGDYNAAKKLPDSMDSERDNRTLITLGAWCVGTGFKGKASVERNQSGDQGDVECHGKSQPGNA
eukprot:1626289-Pleurochrysis_carterae.AAC.12